jgi:hypothetical protein
MLHYSCDLCKRVIDPHGDTRHVVKIEVFAALDDDTGCHCFSDDDSGGADRADSDHLDEMQELLEQFDDGVTASGSDDETRVMRFDLCDECRRKFLRNPLGLRSGKKFGFSNN